MKTIILSLLVSVLLATAVPFMPAMSANPAPALLFSFENDSLDGWKALGPMPTYGIGTSTVSLDSTLGYQSNSAMKISYGGAKDYLVGGPNPTTLPVNTRYEYAFYIPSDSNVVGLSLYTKDQVWKWDSAYVNANSGLVKGRWFTMRTRTMTTGTTPFKEYGIQVVTADEQPGQLHVDAIRQVPEVIEKAVLPPYLRKGLNIDRPLDLPLVQWNSGEPITLVREHFALIRKAGFDFVRIPINPESRAASESPYLIDENYLKRTDWVIRTALSSGLAVVLDLHRYDALMTDTATEKERFLALWRQLSARYAKFSGKLMFELLNEPNHHMSAETWNQLLAETLAVIREKNKSRQVIVGPVFWNSIDQLVNLQLPATDRNLIVTFHYYEPSRFTHQGAEWVEGSDDWLGTTWEGNVIDRYRLRDKFDVAVAWSKANNRPLLLGEFGAYRTGSWADRVRWTQAVRETAQERGIPWAYWELWDGFGVFDRSTGMYRSELLQALLPSKTARKGVGFDRPLVIKRNPTFGFDDASSEGWSGAVKTSTDTTRKVQGSASLKLSLTGRQEYMLYGFHPGSLGPGDQIEISFWLPATSNVNVIKLFSVDSSNKWHDQWYNASKGLVKGKWVKFGYTVPADGSATFKNYGVQLLTTDETPSEVWMDAVRITKAP